MSFINIEIKARVKNPDHIRQYLQLQGADFKGVDKQTDTYFQVPQGRLKLRQGNIENNLIFYQRSDQAGPKQSSFNLVPVAESEGMQKLLTDALGIKTVVRKQREIYYIHNVKFHLDIVEGLGSFVEIEAGNKLMNLPVEKLREQCESYMKAFQIAEEDLLEGSYSDMLESN